ncbi:putative PurR-regulated permease PerM [Arthrobacter pigmenti]|uniref:Putative PurR-regulated permease PerM n=1 Tax=Arthrobacter pigmenti TaxID=271432 RepID=A0A846RQX9_9MICC|nr:putative PurR-regulated permease PerM [Arthrobacter pigmenti]
MSEHKEVPIGEPLPRPASSVNQATDSSEASVAAPRVEVRKRGLGFAMARLRRVVPVAQPRPRFEFPPERNGDVPVDESVSISDDRLKFGGAQPRSMRQHPIHFGFMASVGAGLALLAYFMITNVGQLLVWIGAALFIALGLDPIVRWLEKRHVPRPAGITVALLLLAGIIAAFFATLIPTIVSQTTQLVERAPGYIRDFLNSEFFRNIDQQFEVRERVTEEVNRFFANSEAVGGIFGGVLGVGTVILNSLFGVLIILVLTLYFLASLPGMKKWAYRLAPRSRRPRVERLSEEITRSVGNYVIGQACVALLNATFAFIFMTIAQVPFSVLLAFVVAMLAFIPLVGALIAAVLVSLVALTAGWQTAVLFAVMYVAYLQLEAYFISPRIMQKAVAVPGAVAVIAVIAGGTLLGVLGALIAIPTAAAVMLLLKEVFIARQDSQ